MNESIWSKTAQSGNRAPLSCDLTVEAAVIGGGLAGILTACLLREKGVDAVVLESGRIGGGQTQNTTAKLTAQHGLIYAKLIAQHGPRLAQQYADANQAAIGGYRTLSEKLGIDCELEEQSAFLYTNANPDTLKQEAEAAQSLGLDAAFLTHTDLPFPVSGAVRLGGQAQFHPLKLLFALANGVPVYEQTRVLSVEDGTLATDKGTVGAKHIVFADHYPFPLFPGLFFTKMHQERSYVLALKNANPPEGMYLGVDPDGLSIRHSGKLLLLGGGGHRTGENRAGGKYGLLRQRGLALWPECRETARWSAQDCMTPDGVPYIGKFSAHTPNWYVATGFGKWGMTTSLVAAQILSDRITGVENPWAEVFSPQRATTAAAVKNRMADGLHAVRDLSRALLAPPRAALADLPPGHGGIVEYDGQKVGVYKGVDGSVHAVSTRCPHLGCQVEWNPDEHSWDCPCHGSRFTPEGKLLSGPAQTDLEVPENE